MTSRAPIAAVALAVAAACARTPPPRPAPARLEVGAASAMEAVHVTNPHDHQGKPFCQRCHLDGKSTVSGDPIALCTQCHAPSIMKHPYGVPAKQVPAALPVGEGRKILCHTCHDPHDVKAHRKGLRLEYLPLCAQCHAGHGPRPAPAAPN